MEKVHLESIRKILVEENIIDYQLTNETDEFQGDNYMGTMVKIKITGKNTNGEKILKHLIVKVAPNNPDVRGMVSIRRFYCREIFAYENIFPEFEKLQNKFNIAEENRFHFVDCYSTFMDEPNEFLIMENVQPDGFTIFPRKQALDLQHVKITLEHLARYHALSFALRKLEPVVYKKVTEDVEIDKGYSRNMDIFVRNVIINALKYIPNEEFRKKFQKVASYEKMVEIGMPELCHPYNVLCHGDIWQGNILFKHKDGSPVDVRLIDWQLNKHSSPIIDISHFIFSVTEQSLRDEHYDELLNLYYRTLSHSLRLMTCDPEELYPERVFRQQLKDILVYGLINGTLALTFALREDEDLEDLESSIELAVKKNEYNFEFVNPISAMKFTNRLEDLIKHFIRLEII